MPPENEKKAEAGDEKVRRVLGKLPGAAVIAFWCSDGDGDAGTASLLNLKTLSTCEMASATGSMIGALRKLQEMVATGGEYAVEEFYAMAAGAEAQAFYLRQPGAVCEFRAGSHESDD